MPEFFFFTSGLVEKVFLEKSSAFFITVNGSESVEFFGF